MKVVHIMPEASIFSPVIQGLAREFGHECYVYRVEHNRWKKAKEFFSLYVSCKNKSNRIFFFHSVPHYWIIVLSFLLHNFHYCLLYWGWDYYSTFLDEKEFEQHCIRKSRLLNEKYYRTLKQSRYIKLIRKFRRFIGLKVVSRAEAVISLTPKHFRFLRYFYFKIFRTALTTPHILTRGYAQDPDVVSVHKFNSAATDELIVLICHSATESVAHEQSLEILRKYKEKWGVKINIRGFLSYSGGNELYRDSLERRLKTQAFFADSVLFERKFLSTEEVQDRLQDTHIAVFSCLRDEGVGLLTHFVKMGGIVCFNRFSINYDFFKYFSPNKLLSHEQLLNISPEQLYRKRKQLADPLPKLLQYSEFKDIKIRTRS